MSVTDIKFYSCDTCPRKFDSSGSLKSLVLPARLYDKDGKKFVVTLEPVDLCQVCFDKFFELIDSKFATIEVGGGQRKIYTYLKEEGKENSDAQAKD